MGQCYVWSEVDSPDRQYFHFIQKIEKGPMFIQSAGGKAHFGQRECLCKGPACRKNLYLFIFSFFFYYSYVHTRLGSFLPPAPTPFLTTHSAPSLSPPNTQQKLFCPYL
jgi:hypothetical protein